MVGDLFTQFIDLLKTKGIGNGGKFIIIILTLILLLAIDTFLNISYSFHINNKIYQIKEIAHLSKSLDTNSHMQYVLNNAMYQVVHTKHLKDYFGFTKSFNKSTDLVAESYISTNNATISLIQRNAKKQNTKNSTINAIPPTKKAKTSIPNYYLMFLSTNFIQLWYVLIGCIVLLFNREYSITQTIIYSLIVLLLLWLYGQMMTRVTYQIYHFEDIRWNYAINIIMSILLYVFSDRILKLLAKVFTTINK